MTMFDVSCPIDGRVEVNGALIELVIDPVQEERSTYTFPCPRCRINVVKVATEDAVHLLMRGGVRPAVRRATATPTMAPPRSGAPAFEIEDLRDFAAVLAATDYVADLIGA